MTEIAFPYLFDHSIWLSKTLPFTVFGVHIAWYGAIILCGILLAGTYAFIRCPQFGYTRTQVLEFLIYGVPSCYIGARLYYVIYKWDYYAADPIQILNLKGGGMGIYGGVLGGALSLIIFAHLIKVDVLSAMDLGAICILMGQVIGRWGNFVNGEAYGYVTNLPWGMSINGGDPVHPTFLYESLWNLGVLLLMHFRSKHPKFRGEVMLWYIVGYGSGRAWIEGLRTDSLYLWGTSIRVSQALAIISAIGAGCVLAYFYITKRYPKPFVPAVVEKETSNQTKKKKKRKKSKQSR